MSENTSPTEDRTTERSTQLASNPLTYKIRGTLDDPGATAIFGFNQSGSGTGRGVLGRVDSAANDAAGVRGEAASGNNGAAGDGVVGITEDPGANNQFATGVRGEATNATDTQTAGVYGRTAGTADGTRGVNGIADDASGGRTYGVVGTSFGAGTGAAGVLGAAVDGSTKNYGVEGTTGSTATGAAGVHGSADDTSGQTYGVHGVTKSEEVAAAGVRGEATGANGATYGVYGSTNSPTGYGIYSAGDAFVNGALDVSGDASADSLSTTNDVSAGGSLSATDDLSIGGYQEVGDLGATVVLENTVTLSNNTKQKVPFDATTVDDFSDFEAEENAYLTSLPGDYHVTASLQFGTEAFGSYSESFDLFIRVDGVDRAQLLGQRGRAGQISKTIRNVGEDQAIEIWAEPKASTSPTLENPIDGTYVTIDKIG